MPSKYRGVKPGRVGNMVFISTKPKSRQYTAADGVRSKRYKAVRGDLPDPDVLKWCDFVVFAEEDLLVQRIYKDAEVARVIREKGDYFFFYHYLI
ncbi:hypothetical protein G5714_002665 [Onychostoma macrolepis]|uniref:Uncharacterized protein n=1 Tax=Onychostoma macrolepis TaxID=369639 RepID=A0A7J6D7C1_9TELE|nr:hypothetical protein G5714_002665 [Onychostoma macrolepis]